MSIFLQTIKLSNPPPLPDNSTCVVSWSGGRWWLSENCEGNIWDILYLVKRCRIVRLDMSGAHTLTKPHNISQKETNHFQHKLQITRSVETETIISILPFNINFLIFFSSVLPGNIMVPVVLANLPSKSHRFLPGTSLMFLLGKILFFSLFYKI